ncbi:MAG: hypothetical protein R3C04_11005 [Hyphomonas sp.]
MAVTFYDGSVNAFDTDAVLRTLEEWDFGFVHEFIAWTRIHNDTVTAKLVAPKRLSLLDWYQFLDRHADNAFPLSEARAMKRRYWRHYMRRLLSIRRSEQGREIWCEHMQQLSRLGVKPSVRDFIDAALDWTLIALGRRFAVVSLSVVVRCRHEADSH